MVEPKKPKTLTEKVVLYWRLMGDSSDVEAEMGMREFRKLRKEGVDIRAITSAMADWYEQGGKPPNPEEIQAAMQEIYDSAYSKGYTEGAENGKRSAILAAQPMGIFATSVNDDINGYPSLQVAQHLALNKHRFDSKHHEFIDDMPGKIARFGQPTPKQAEYLRSLFMRIGGRI